MTTKEELKAKKRHRYMLQGPVGSGKSYTLVLLAKRYVEHGNKVLYIDYRDIGAVDELLKLNKSTLKHIEYAAPHEYEDLLKLKWSEDLGLIIFDAMHHLRFRSRKYIVRHYLKQGHYTVNGKENEIEDLETFDLGTLGGYGTGYGAASLREDDVIDRILNAPCDVAISAIADKPKEDSDTFTEILTGNFDNILNLSFQDTKDGIRKWYYTLYRWRGIETNDYSPHRNEGEMDPFAIIEKTGGKRVREYMIRFNVAGQPKKEFIKAIDTAGAEAELRLIWPEAEEIEVVE